MTNDDTDLGEPSGLDDPQYGELAQDGLLPGQVQAGEPELDADGVPAQTRPARDRDRLLQIAGLICGIISAGLAITDYNHKLAGWLVALGFLAGGLAWGLPALQKRKPGSNSGRWAPAFSGQHSCLALSAWPG
jgi:hypothetical protein